MTKVVNLPSSGTKMPILARFSMSVIACLRQLPLPRGLPPTPAARSAKTDTLTRSSEGLMPERAAGIRFGQRLASENDFALVQFVRVA